MAKKRYRPEEIAIKLRQAEVSQSLVLTDTPDHPRGRPSIHKVVFFNYGGEKLPW